VAVPDVIEMVREVGAETGMVAATSPFPPVPVLPVATLPV
jgi:hypothetical protein